MIGKSYGYVIFDDDGYCAITLNREKAIEYIQERLLRNTYRIEYVKECMKEEGYNPDDKFMRKFIERKLIQEPYYFDNIYYVEAPLIEN